MWIFLACASAFFAGVTSVLAKCGIKKTDSTVATAIRTGIVLLMAAVMVMIAGSFDQIRQIAPKTWCFLILSGLATGASWLCYFRALQTGDINGVVPIDKSSTVLSVLLAVCLLGEPISLPKGIGIAMIAVGTFFMIEKKAVVRAERTGSSWLLYACLSALFAALTSVLGKIGMDGVESNLGTLIRTMVVLPLAWGMVFVTKKGKTLSSVPKKELGFICLSGIATGASWLCYYKALRDGLASVVVPIDKLSILVTVAFSYLVFHEKLSRKAMVGLALMVVGTLMLAVL